MSRGWAGGSTTAWRKLRTQAIATLPHWCDYCNEPISPAYTYPHPRSMSVDHIVPKAHGGQDHLANLRLRHYGCNSAAGARTTTPTPLSITIPTTTGRGAPP